MPLDPDVAKILKMMENLQMPDIEQTDIKELRRMIEQSPLPKKSESVKEVRDMDFDHHGISIPMRLYVPENAGTGLILYFHGGGFVYGSRDTHDDICRMAANRSRSRVLSVEYRLAPENKFPAALDDALESFLWVQENAKRLGIDPSNVAVAGDSAGGNIAAALCLRAKDEGLPLPRMQVLIYPSCGRSGSTASMSEYSENFFLTESQMTYFGRAYLNNTADLINPYFSIILHPDLSGLPEAIVVTAEYDPLRDEGEAYLARLWKAGVRSTGIRAKGMIHGFANFFPVIPASEDILIMIWTLVGTKLNEVDHQVME